MSGFPYPALWKTWIPGALAKVNYPVLVIGPQTETAAKEPVVLVCYQSPFSGKFEDIYALVADLVGAE